MNQAEFFVFPLGTGTASVPVIWPNFTASRNGTGTASVPVIWPSFTASRNIVHSLEPARLCLHQE